MKMDDYLGRITNYIINPQFTRALLIDGEWGCGKSYFVKNTLIKEIKNTEVKQPRTKEGTLEQENKEQNKLVFYTPLMISLYGLDSIEAIQSLMYSVMLEEYAFCGKDDKFQSTLKNVPLLGTKLLKGVAEFLNLKESAQDIFDTISTHFLSSHKESIVLIFDDLERCQVDTIVLMGFLNNLCENCGYRVIVIANEEEISRKENDVALAIQKQTALFDLYGKAVKQEISNLENMHHQNSVAAVWSELQKDRNKIKDSIFRNTLDKHVDVLFDRNILYEKTREKLIGLTVHFESNIEEAYEKIARNTISEDFRDYMIHQKRVIVDAFENAHHKNLRTLISVFIAIEGIVGNINPVICPDMQKKCQEYDIDIDEIIEAEKSIVIDYIVRTAIQKTLGGEAHNWRESRYSSIGSGFTLGKSDFGYAFVDEYWISLVADSVTINTDFLNRINERLISEIQKRKDKEHFDLSLYKLSEWYLDADEVVKANIDSLKEELKNKNYYASEFKDIICTLLRINNLNFGMAFDKRESLNSDSVYDALDDVIFSINSQTDVSDQNEYEGWRQQNLEEYVGLMLKYFDDQDFEIKKDSLRMLSSDLGFVKKYRGYIQPILDKIEEKEIQRLKVTEEGINLFSDPHADFYGFFKSRVDSYFSKGQFLSLYGFDKINNIIVDGTPKDIFNLSDAIHAIYKNLNLRDCFADDYSVIEKLWRSLKEDREGNREIYNPGKSRTQEIALRKIESDFWEYRKAFMDSYTKLVIDTKVDNDDAGEE